MRYPRPSDSVLGFCLALAGLAGCGSQPAPPPPLASPPPSPPPQVVAETEPQPSAPAPPASTLQLSPSSFTLGLDDPGLQLAIRDTAPTTAFHDVTAQASWEAAPGGLVEIDDQGYLRPLTAGQVQVTAHLPSGQSLTSQVEVEPYPAGQRTWDFARDVVPLFTRYGCNTGSCHGRAAGQQDFHLSLFGYDPESDHQAITRRAGSRRIDPFQASRSLLLLKATGQVPHSGGVRLTPRDPAYQVLERWIASNAPFLETETPASLTSVTVDPQTLYLDGPGSAVIRVLAHYSDGKVRDVTRLAGYQSRDDSVVTIDPLGRVQLLRRGETDLVTRFQSAVVATRVTTLINPDLDFNFDSVPRHNLVDDHLLARLAALRVPPSPAADDATFLRRVTLDLTGQLPSPLEVSSFLDDTNPDKRQARIDQLIASRDFLKFWGIKFGDLLQITSARFPTGSGYYQMWLEQNLDANTPWDQMVRELLTTLGNPNTRDGGAANYALDGPDPKVRAEQTAQRFLGLRFRCAQCHDHPFDVWTQDQYFGLAAFFAKAGLAPPEGSPPGMMADRASVQFLPKGEVTHLRTSQPAVPSLPAGTTPEIPPDIDPRVTLADWITRPGNPFFARAMANWVWAQLFGRGLCDPADDLSASNPPVHPELLDALARDFENNHYDLRALIRLVASSRAYELSSRTVPGNQDDNRLFARHYPRPLDPYQLADALAQATDVPNAYPNKPRDTRAIDVFDPATNSTILETLGRCDRAVACSSVNTPPLSLRHSLLLISGDLINGKVGSLNGYLANLLEITREPADIVENLYLRTLSRAPTKEELSHWSAELQQSSSLEIAAEDLFWALLNSREFSFIH